MNKSSKSKNNKPKPKTVEELTKGFEELAKKKGWEGITKEDFEENLKKLAGNSKDNQK